MKPGDKLLQDLGLPKSFCFAPYVNVDCDQDGTLRACYRSKDDTGIWKGNDIIAEFNNDKFADIRTKLWNGEYHSNCKQCYHREQDGLFSTRGLYNDMMANGRQDQAREIAEQVKQDITKVKVENILTAEFRPSSLCNLQCLHCNHYSSTQWINTAEKYHDELDEFLNLNEDDFTKGNVVKRLKHTMSSNVADIKDFLHDANNLDTIEFTGGEPLMDPQHIDWLNAIPNKAKMSIFYHSNLNVYGLEKLIEVWKQFKKVYIRASIDVSPQMYPYFRQLGDITRLNNNIKLLSDANIRVTGTLTVNMFTLLDWTNTVKYWVANNWRLHTSFVELHPTSAQWLPETLKQSIVAELEASKELLTYEREDYVADALENIDRIKDFISRTVVDTLPEKTVKYIKTMDNISGMSYKDYVPQLEEFMNER